MSFQEYVNSVRSKDNKEKMPSGSSGGFADYVNRVKTDYAAQQATMLTPQQVLQQGRERFDTVNAPLATFRKANTARNEQYANLDLDALKTEIKDWGRVVDIYNGWEIPSLSQRKNDGSNYSMDDINAAKKQRDEYVARLTNGLSIADVRKLLKSKTDEYNTAYSVQAPKIQAEEFRKNFELENYSEGKAKSGLDAFYAMKKESNKAKENKTFLERMGESLAYTPQTDFDLSPVIRAYEQDSAYKEPNDDWTQEQLNIFGYLFSFNREKAYEYAIQVNDSINKTKTDEAKGRIAEGANSALTAVPYAAGAILSAPLGLADWLDAVIETTVRGRTTNKGVLTPHDFSETVIESQSEALNKFSGKLPEEIPVLGGKGLGDVYGLATSMVQSSLAAATGSSATALLSFFGSAAASGMKEARERGVDDSAAVLYGFASGLAEAIPEMLAVDKLLKLKSSDGLMKALVKQGFTEGLTEGMTSVLTQVSDNIINGDFSQFNEIKEKYISQGLTEQEASKKAWSDIAENIAFESLAGFAMGGTQAGIRLAPAAISQRLQDKPKKDASSSSKIDSVLNLSAADAKIDAVQQSVNKAIGYKALTEDQKQLKRMGEQFGAKVKFDNLTTRTVDEDGNEVVFAPEGEYDPNTNTITLNTDVRPEHRPALFILKHELTHSIEKAGKDFERFTGNVEISEAFEEYAKTKTNSQTGESFNTIDEWYNDIIYKYRKAGKTLGGNGISETEAAKREAIADFVGDCLFGGNNAATEKLLNGLKGEERNKFVALVKRIFAKLKEFFGGTEKLSEIERLENEFLAVANKVAEMNATETETAAKEKTTDTNGGGIKHSIATFPDGNQYVVVDIDQARFDGLTPEEMRKEAKKAIKEHFVGRVIGDKNKAFVKKDSAEEYAYPSKFIKDTKILEAKMRAAPELDNLVESGKNFRNEPDGRDGHIHPEATGGFDYYDTVFKVGKNYYYGLVNIMVTDRGRVLKDITQIEDITNDIIAQYGNPQGDFVETSSKHSIPNSSETVNKNSSTQNDIKQSQIEIIKETNPMWDDYHTGIRNVDDIRTWEEVLGLNDEREGQFVWGDFSREDAEQALKDGTITVYSSYPIKNGVFVSTSYIQAEEYAGGRGGKVYSKTIPLTDVAWINGDEGQYAEVYNIRYSLPENPTPEQIGQALYDHEISMEKYRELIVEANKRAVQASGAIDQGEMVAPPNKPNPTPVSVKPGTKVSEHVRTILESGYASPDMEAFLKENVLEGLGSFVPTNNKKNINKAVKDIQNQGYQNALHSWRSELGKSTVNSNTVARGEALLRLAMEHNSAVDAVNIAADLAELSTRTAQSLQAFSLLKRMGGMGQLVYIQRSVNKINEDLQKRFKSGKKAAPVVKINQKLAERLAKAETEGEYEVLYAKIVQDVAKQVPSTFLDKWNAWRYMAMLVNPTTHFRNILGNGIFLPAVRMKDILAISSERIFIKQENRTKVLKVKKEYQDFAEKDFAIVEPLLTGTGKYNPSDNIRDQQTIFKNKVLEGIRKMNFGALEKEDSLFLRKHYRHALGGFLQARNIDLSNITSEQLTQARNYAFNEALKATYRDASMVANMVSRLSKTNGFANVLVEGILPFKKTPINVLKRGIEYSPIGLIKTVGKAIRDLHQGEYSGTEFIDGLASATTGTGLMIIGIWLASLGIVKGGFDDEEEFDRLMGKQEYSVQIGDVSYTIDWAAPSSIPFFMGVALQEYKADEDGDWLSNIYKFGLKGFEPILNLSMLAGVNDVIESVSYAEDAENIPQLVGTAAGSYFSQALPTIFGKTANVFDDTRRTKYIDKTSNIPQIVQSALDRLSSKVPFLSKTRAEYIDAWGNTKYTGNAFLRFFQQYVSPGYASTVDESAISEETLRLYRETGEKSLTPSTPARYFTFKGNRRDLSKEEYFDYATLRGQLQAELINDAIQSKEYAKLTDEQKAELVKKLYDFASNYAKTTLSYSYEEVAAMEGGQDVLTRAKWQRLNDKAKRLLVNEYFFDSTEMKAYNAYQRGNNVVEGFANKILEESKK